VCLSGVTKRARPKPRRCGARPRGAAPQGAASNRIYTQLGRQPARLRPYVQFARAAAALITHGDTQPKMDATTPPPAARCRGAPRSWPKAQSATWAALAVHATCSTHDRLGPRLTPGKAASARPRPTKATHQLPPRLHTREEFQTPILCPKQPAKRAASQSTTKCRACRTRPTSPPAMKAASPPKKPPRSAQPSPVRFNPVRAPSCPWRGR
jgi:hypothetical protein